MVLNKHKQFCEFRENELLRSKLNQKKEERMNNEKKTEEEKEGGEKKKRKALLAYCTSPLIHFCLASSARRRLPRSAGHLDKRRRAAKCCSASFSSPIPGNLGSTVTQFLWLLTVTASIPSPPRWIRRWAWCDPGWGFGREVMVEKQMAAHCVDRAICAWFWDYVVAHAAGDPSKVKPPALTNFGFSVPLLITAIHSNPTSCFSS
jgi:hypothetical protein